MTIRPIITPQIEEQFQHVILFHALKDLGYTVAAPEEAEYQTLHLALGAGDADFTAVSWRSLHDAFYQEAGGDAVLSRVGSYVGGALQGYLVDKKSYDAGITDLSMLKDPAVAAKFDADGDGKADLAGCVPGWGCERVIETGLDAYGLRDTVSHNQASYQAIIADTMARFETGALVPGRDVEWLSVPFTALPDEASGATEFEGKNLGFAVDQIGVVARKEFLSANPAAAKLFELATLDINDISAQNKLIADGQASAADIETHASDWIKAHQAEYDGWLAAARAAE